MEQQQKKPPPDPIIQEEEAAMEYNGDCAAAPRDQRNWCWCRFFIAGAEAATASVSIRVNSNGPAIFGGGALLPIFALILRSQERIGLYCFLLQRMELLREHLGKENGFRNEKEEQNKIVCL